MSIAGGIKKRLFQGFLSVLLLSGCAMNPQQSASSATPLPLLPAASLVAAHSAQQLVRVAFGDTETTMQCLVQFTPQRMTVIAVNAMGLRLFSISVEDGKTTVERAPGMPEQVQPERILSDIQFAYWPLKRLQDFYQGTAWQISEPFAGTRRLKRDGRLIAEVHYAKVGGDPWRGHLWLSNYEFGYSLAVDSQPGETH